MWNITVVYQILVKIKPASNIYQFFLCPWSLWESVLNPVIKKICEVNEPVNLDI